MKYIFIYIKATIIYRFNWFWIIFLYILKQLSLHWTYYLTILPCINIITNFLFNQLPIHLFNYLSIYSTNYPSIQLTIHLFNYLYIYSTTYPSIQTKYLSIKLNIHLFSYISIHSNNYLSTFHTSWSFWNYTLTYY